MSEAKKPWFKELHWQIAIGMLFGVILGVTLQSMGQPEWATKALGLGGDIFLRLLKMIVLPLVAASLFLGVTGVGSSKDLSVLGTKTFVYYLFTSLISITVGLVFVNIISPGTKVSIELEGLTGKVVEAPSSFMDILLRMIPVNPFGSLAAVPFDMLAVIFFVIILGVFALKVTEEKRRPLVDLADSLNEVMIKMVHGILSLAPIGVFCLVAELVAEAGLEVFISLSWYLVTVGLALAFHFFVILPAIYYYFRRENPFHYMSQMSPALLTAFSSASSAATLSLTMECSQKNKKVSPKISSIVLPLGATINMDGTALYEGVAVLFIAQFMGMDITLFQQFLVLLTALLASVGAAGIPHAGLVTMVLILNTLGLPDDSAGLILAVDRVVDMARTATNVWSDSIGAALVEKFSTSGSRAEVRS